MKYIWFLYGLLVAFCIFCMVGNIADRIGDLEDRLANNCQLSPTGGEE